MGIGAFLYITGDDLTFAVSKELDEFEIKIAAWMCVVKYGQMAGNVAEGFTIDSIRKTRSILGWNSEATIVNEFART